MDGGARRSETSPDPGWGDARRAVMAQADACACAVAGMALRGGDCPGLAAAEQAVAVLRDLAEQLRRMAADEAVIEAEAARRAAAYVTAAGLVPPPGRRHLRAV